MNVKEVAVILYIENPDVQSWNGDAFGFDAALGRGEFQANLAIRQAEKLVSLYKVEKR